ncbi:MAG: histidine--tRNA ligase [Patescibacteria group bacterium]
MSKKLKRRKTIKSSKKGKVLLQSLKGMHDILPENQLFWEKVRISANKIADFYNFLRIDTPILESAEIFERTGEGTDIVEKEMYFVKTKGGDRLVLRPEGTAPVIRAYIQHGLAKMSQPLRLFYIGPMFRHEQPQSGRFRQHHQVGFEILGGDNNPIYDIFTILAPFRLLEELKIKNLMIQINSIGCKNCRSAYSKKLQEYYKGKQDKICKDCKKRLVSRPLRLLDCKNEKCAEIKIEAPVIIDKLCTNCKNHLKSILEHLDELSLPYSINPYLVRGLDYYNGMVFEIFSETGKEMNTDNNENSNDKNNGQNKESKEKNLNFTLASGGRYDGLAEMLGGPKISAVGGSVGIERAIEAMKFYGVSGVLKNEVKVFLIHIGGEAKKKNIFISEELRKVGIKTVEYFGKDSLKSQLRAANKGNASLTLIIGQKEVFEESVIIRNMKTGVQEAVPLERVGEEVKKRLK